MNLIKSLKRCRLSFRLFVSILVFTGAAASFSRAQTVPTLQIKADQVVAKVKPDALRLDDRGNQLFLRRRALRRTDPQPHVQGESDERGLLEHRRQWLNLARPGHAAERRAEHQLETGRDGKATKDSPAGIANGGYWGIPVRPNTTYRVSFYAKAASGFTGPLTVAITSTDGKAMFASADVTGITGDWKKYEVTLTTKNAEPSKD